MSDEPEIKMWQPNFMCGSCYKTYTAKDDTVIKKSKGMGKSLRPICSKCAEKHNDCKRVGSISCSIRHWIRGER